MGYGKFRLDKTKYKVRKSSIIVITVNGILGQKINGMWDILKPPPPPPSMGPLSTTAQFMPKVNTLQKLNKLFTEYMLYDFLPAVGY